MAEIDVTYDKLRILLSPRGYAQLPKNELSNKLLRNMYTEEEAEIIVKSFEKTGIFLQYEKIKELTHIPDEKLKKILKNMKIKGNVVGRGPIYMMLPYLPGLFEFYFVQNQDDPERMKKVGEAHHALLKSGFHRTYKTKGGPGWRVIPAVEPVEKIIELNQTIEATHEILPFEILKPYLSKQDRFAVQPCSCRIAFKLAGDPCKRTDENFCVSTGDLAARLIKYDIAREVTLDEMMKVMKKAESEGLVHSTTNMQDTSTFICNCCSCCCGFLTGVKDFGNRDAVAKSNFEPSINHEECALCETCVNICPMEAIHLNESSSEEYIAINLDLCIGCGVCASNCPQGALNLKKVRNYIPVEKRTGIFG